MNSSRARSDRAVLLPTGQAFNADARLVGEVLGTAASAASRTLDDTRFLVPALTWRIAAEAVADLATDERTASGIPMAHYVKLQVGN